MLHRLAVAALSLTLVATPAWAETLVVTAARMVDVERGRYVDNPVVVVTDGRALRTMATKYSKMMAAITADRKMAASRMAFFMAQMSMATIFLMDI